MGILIVGLLAADIVLPTPSSFVSLVAAIYFGFFWGTVLIFIGMTLCCLFGYYLGKSGHSIAQRYVTEPKPTNAQPYPALLQRIGPWSLLISRPIPVLAETSVVLAGIAHVPLRKFLLFTLPANALVAMVYGLTSFWGLFQNSVN